MKWLQAGKINFALLDKALTGLTESGGIYFDAMGKQSKTFNGTWSTVEGNIDEVKKSLGNMIMVALKPLLEVAGDVLGWLVESPIAMGVVKVMMLSIIPIVGIIAVAAVKALVIQFGALAASTLAALWPIYLIIAAVIAISLAVEDLYTWMTGGESVIGAWIDKGGVLGAVLKFLFAPLIGIAWAVKNLIGLATGGPSAFRTFFTAIKSGVLAIYDFLKTYGKFFVMALFPLTILYFYFDQIVAFVSAIPSRILTFFASIPDRILSYFSGLPGKLKSLLSDSMPEWLKNGISVVAGSAQSEQITGARADGGDVDAGRLYKVGERGPEMFRPSRNGTIIPNGGGASGKSFIFAPVIHVTAGDSNGSSIAQAVKDALYQVFSDMYTPLGLEES